jgi:hypothetical protein
MIGNFLILPKYCFILLLLRNSKLMKLPKKVRANSSIFLNITPSSPLKINKRFRATYLHFQARRISRTRHQHEAVSK